MLYPRIQGVDDWIKRTLGLALNRCCEELKHSNECRIAYSATERAASHPDDAAVEATLAWLPPEAGWPMKRFPNDGAIIVPIAIGKSAHESELGKRRCKDVAANAG
jgi:hypothetical protein